MVGRCATCHATGTFTRVTATGTSVEWPCPVCDPDTCALCGRRDWPVRAIEARRLVTWNARERGRVDARFAPLLGVDHDEARICDGCWSNY